MKKTKYSLNDTDIEHLNQSPHSLILPPRVISTQALERFGWSMTYFKLISDFMGLDQHTKAFGKKEKFSGIREKMILKFKTPKGKIEDTKFGDITYSFDSSSNRMRSKFISPRDLDEKDASIWNLFVETFLEIYLNNIFPLHANFILKDSIATPLPFPYLEVYVKASKATAGNAFADINLATTSDRMMLQ